VVILGFPSDLGTVRNNGREGSRTAPAEFRAKVARLGVRFNPELELGVSVDVLDAGDVIPAPAAARDVDLEAAHRRLEVGVRNIVAAGGIPFVVGGSNDQSYPNARGLLRALAEEEASASRALHVVNVDAHLDVRPLKQGLAHSGSPFRQLLEDPLFAGGSFTEFAAQGMQCAAEHVEYLRARGARVLWLQRDLRRERGVAADEHFRRLLEGPRGAADAWFVSFDIDSVCAADCPGVSAPSPLGLTAAEALAMCLAAGAHPRVRLFDLSELNPAVEADRSVRLAAFMFYHFVLGVSARVAAAAKGPKGNEGSG
jgi:formiminoglutamase